MSGSVARAERLYYIQEAGVVDAVVLGLHDDKVNNV